MLWVTWRQHRVTLIALLGGSVALAIITVFVTAYAQRLRVELGVDTCVPLANTNANCVDLAQEWRRRLGAWLYLFQAFYIVPALVASYVGGPLLAREIERGTHRLCWTQGISRTRWTLTLVGVVVVFTAAAALTLALVGGQTRVLLGTSDFRPWDTFDVEGPALVAFMIFGVALAAFIGAWRRRILAGMFYGLVVFGLIRSGIWAEMRPFYERPVAVAFSPFVFTGPFSAPVQSRIPKDAWLIGIDAVDGQGRPVPQARVNALLDENELICRSGRGCDSVQYLNDHDVYQRSLYQPADRYWRFQLYEAGLYLALTVALVAGTLVMLRRRDA